MSSSNKTEIHREYLQCLLMLCTEFVMNNHTPLFVILDENEKLDRKKRPRHVRSCVNNRNEAEDPQVQPALCRDDRNEAEDPQVQPALCRDNRNDAEDPQVQPALCRDDRNEAEDPQVQPALCRDDRNDAEDPQVQPALCRDDRNDAEDPQVQPALCRDDRNDAEDPQVQPVLHRDDRNNAQGPQVPIQDGPGWQWINTQSGGNYRPRNIPFQGSPGLVNPIPNEEPYSFFKLYFTDAVVDKIVEETNRYAGQYIQANRDNLRARSIVHLRKPTNADEVNTFLGLSVLMGLMYKP